MAGADSVPVDAVEEEDGFGLEFLELADFLCLYRPAKMCLVEKYWKEISSEELKFSR